MDAFIQAIAVVGAICLGIFALAIFFTILTYLNKLVNRAGSKLFKAQDFIKNDSLVTVHLAEGQILDRVKFLGFTKASVNGGSTDERIPYGFSVLAVFANADGSKIFVRPEAINSLQELPSQV